MAISALAVVVGAGTAGIYTHTTTGDSTPAMSYPPVAEALAPAPSSDSSELPVPTTSTPAPVEPPPTATRPSPPPTPRETSEPEHTPSTSPPEETTESEPPRTTESESAHSPQTLLLRLVNEVRAEAGCEPVALDSRLSRAAADHSEDMSDRDYFSHLSPEGNSFVQRVLESGYPEPGAENIAMGHRTAERVMQGWMESEGHRENILDCSLNTMGIGVVTDGWYWTQLFGR